MHRFTIGQAKMRKYRIEKLFFSSLNPENIYCCHMHSTYCGTGCVRRTSKTAELRFLRVWEKIHGGNMNLFFVRTRSELSDWFHDRNSFLRTHTFEIANSVLRPDKIQVSEKEQRTESLCFRYSSLESYNRNSVSLIAAQDVVPRRSFVYSENQLFHEHRESKGKWDWKRALLSISVFNVVCAAIDIFPKWNRPFPSMKFACMWQKRSRKRYIEVKWCWEVYYCVDGKSLIFIIRKYGKFMEATMTRRPKTDADDDEWQQQSISVGVGDVETMP